MDAVRFIDFYRVDPGTWLAVHAVSSSVCDMVEAAGMKPMIKAITGDYSIPVIPVA